MNDELSEKLVELLDRERDALKSSNFEDIAEIAIRKQELSALIQQAPPKLEKSRLKDIQIKAQGNAAFFEASLKGMKSAIDRIEEVRHSFGQLKTYDVKGQVAVRRTLSPSISKKA